MKPGSESTVAEVALARPTQGERPSRGRLADRRPLLLLLQALLVLVVLVSWELSARNELINERLFGRPTGMLSAIPDYLTGDRGPASFRSTGLAVALAFVIGSVSGTVAGLMLGMSDFLDRFLGPFLTPLNSVPRIALAPLFVAWFGLTTTAKVVLAVSIVFFILAENSRSAVRSVDADLMTMARVNGLKRSALLWKVVLPSAVPTLFAGLRLTFTYSLLGVIASEMIAARRGVGQDLVFFSSSYQINSLFAALLILLVFAGVVNVVFTIVERRLLVWQRP